MVQIGPSPARPTWAARRASTAPRAAVRGRPAERGRRGPARRSPSSRETEGRLYFSALVRELKDEPSEADPALIAEVLERFRALAGLADDAPPPEPPAAWPSPTPSPAPSICPPGPSRSCWRAATSERAAADGRRHPLHRGPRGPARTRWPRSARAATGRSRRRERRPGALAPAEDYARLRPGGSGAAVRGRAALIWVEGPDAEGFLHGLLSNDVAGLAPGGSCRALLLDAKGHLQADLRVRRDGPDAFTVVTAPAAADLVMGLLDKHHFSEELDLIGPEEVELLTVAGAPDGAEELADLSLPGTLPAPSTWWWPTPRRPSRGWGFRRPPPRPARWPAWPRGSPWWASTRAPARSCRRRASRATPSPSRRAATWARRPWRDSSSGAGPTASCGGCGCRTPRPRPAGRCGPAGARWVASPASRPRPTWASSGSPCSGARWSRAPRSRSRGPAGPPRGRASLRPVSDPVRLGPARAGRRRRPGRGGAHPGRRRDGPGARNAAGGGLDRGRLGLPLPAARGRPPGGGARAPRRAARRSSASPGAARIRSRRGRPATLTGGGVPSGGRGTLRTCVPSRTRGDSDESPPFRRGSADPVPGGGDRRARRPGPAPATASGEPQRTHGRAPRRALAAAAEREAAEQPPGGGRHGSPRGGGPGVRSPARRRTPAGGAGGGRGTRSAAARGRLNFLLGPAGLHAGGFTT